jgi:hypothetical protein
VRAIDIFGHDKALNIFGHKIAISIFGHGIAIRRVSNKSPENLKT